MKQILLIAANHGRILSKDKTALAMVLLLPLILSLVTGLAFGGGGQSRSYQVPVAFVDHDGGVVAESIRSVFSQSPYLLHETSATQARQLVNDRTVVVAVMVPAGLEASLRNQEPIDLTILRSDYQESPRIVEQELTALLLEIRATAAAANLLYEQGIPWLEAYDEVALLWQPQPPVVVEVEGVAREADPSIPMGFDLASPGYVVMFGLMLAVSGGASSLLAERDGGTLARLMAGPVSRWQLLMGKFLGFAVTGFFQMSLLIALGAMLFGVNWGANVPALIMLVVALSLAASGLGMLLASLCRTSSQASSIGVLTVLVLSMLGGTWWPLEVMPQSLQFVAKTIPSGWAMEGFTQIIMRGAALGDVALHALVLCLFAGVFLAVGVRLFRYH